MTNEGGVFDELTERIIIRFKQNLLAEMGQMSHQAGSGESAIANYELDPVAGGLEIAGELLKHVGMKRPPAMLQYKVAQALGQLMNNSKVLEEALSIPSIIENFSNELFKEFYYNKSNSHVKLDILCISF